MKYKTIKSFALISIVTISNIGCATNHVRVTGDSFHSSGHEFSFNRGKRTINIKLGVAVSAWAVNCSKTRAIAWGQKENINEIGSQPTNAVYIIDIEHDKIVSGYTVTRGPYEAVFSDDQSKAQVDDYVVDQNTGKVIGMTDDINLAPESCPSFPGKNSE